MSTKEINNPGKGNCAFYGFSIGLIDIIKHEYKRYGKSSTFSFLANQVDDFDISLSDIINFNYFRQSNSLLDKMQQHLRTILFDYRKKNIIDNIEHPPACNAFVNFAEMVWNYVNNHTTSPDFNELAKSNEAKRYARQIAAQIKNLEQWYPEKRADVEYNRQREAYFDNLIKESFIKDVFVKGNSYQLKNDSAIVNAMKDVRRNYRWGTQTDLNELAHIFDVNLHTLINGEAPYIPKDTLRRPIITMNNQNNTHWTTNLSFLSAGFVGKKYDSCIKDSVLSKQEIKAILQTYTQGFMALVTTRNHIEEAKLIIEDCDDGDLAVNDIVQKLRSYLERKDFNSNSSFKKRADYIIARAEYFNEASVLTKQEIKAILQTYTQGLMASVTNNHIEKAQQIIDQCDNSDFDVNDIVQMLSNYLEQGEFNSNSSFKKLADNILAKAMNLNDAPNLNNGFAV